MFEDALRLEPARRPGRWIIQASHSGRPWIAVVEPEAEEQVLVIATAYPQETRP